MIFVPLSKSCSFRDLPELLQERQIILDVPVLRDAAVVATMAAEMVRREMQNLRPLKSPRLAS
jgi:hypothetical protein